MTRAGHGLVAVALILACRSSDSPAPERQSEASADEVIEKVSDVGPLVAKVTLAPKAPRIGDVLTLTLRVEADPGVHVELPPFGEALGRFSVVKFKPERAHDENIDGKQRVVMAQVYTLQAAASGRQRVPGLRIEYQPEGKQEALELITDEIPIAVESVVAATEIGDELSAPPTPLDESPGLPPWIWPALAGAIALAVIALALWMRGRRHTNAIRNKLRAYDRALSRLTSLEARPLPAPEEADAFFVELSGIVRQYLEDRLQLRAPELTTEEFLQLAKGHTVLEQAVRQNLSRFLADCDRVKFAAYAPEPEETAASLELARNILVGQEQFLREREARLAESEAS